MLPKGDSRVTSPPYNISLNIGALGEKKFFSRKCCLAAMVGGPAMAADMPIRPPAPPPPVVYYDWTGAYIGFNVGGVWYEVDRTFPSDPLASISNHRTSDSDGILGFHAGTQWQWGAWVSAEVLVASSRLQLALRPIRSASTKLPTFSPRVDGWAMPGTAL
jgi:hypothetical protein